MKKILLAEDDKDLSRSMDTWLTLEGFQVLSVYNGEEALNKLLQEKFDLLITDLAMPRLDGLELIQQIRSVAPQLPIMVVSGKLNDEVRKVLDKQAVTLVVSKPIRPIEFRKIIGTLFPDELYA